MEKLLLMSVLVATIAVPAVAARERHPRTALRKLALYVVAFHVAYLLALRFIYPRLV